MRVGVFGGTFNPIHLAHIRMAEEYRRRLALEKLILVPAFIPPHKSANGLADAQDRLMMCHLAAEGLEGVEVCDYEIRQAECSYTFKTLRYLQGQYLAGELYLLMGADMFLTVQDWRQPGEIYRLATLCACEREQGELTLIKAHKQRLELQGARCVLLDTPPMELSSTMVRKGIKAGEDVSGLLHPAVRDFIVQQHLYRDSSF